MPERFSGAQREYIDGLITRAEGDFCLGCYFERGIRRRDIRKKDGTVKKRIVIEHADNDPKNNMLGTDGNVHHVCRSCNKRLESLKIRDKVKKIRGYSALLERERQREGLPTWKDVLKDTVTYDGATTEVQLNRKYHPIWLRYVINRVREEGSVNRRALIVAAAKIAGCSKQTSTNYLDVEVSDAENAVLKESVDEDGDKIIVLRGENG